ncbi:hypothetical protein AALH12_07350 [Streptococcus ferus]|uniref:hypothetical protein n=1 Tax=Streptococcus ferus TaxID=1345 RepID=UPI00351213AA
MSKSVVELTAEIVSSLHDELYKAYNLEKDFTKPFGEYVAEQYELIYNGMNKTIAKSYE